MGKTKGVNKAEFEVGSQVRMADRAFLERFLEAGQYHNELEPEQLEYAGRVAEVKKVSFSRRRRDLHAGRHSRRVARGVPERGLTFAFPRRKIIMAVDVIMPQMGESIFEGTITKWLKKPGDKIERDEPLFEISTDKVDAEIPSPAAGVLKEIKVNEGQTVPIQTVVAVIDVAGAVPGAPASCACSRSCRGQSRKRRKLRLLPATAPATPASKTAAPAAAPSRRLERLLRRDVQLRPARRFAVRRWCAASRAKTISTSRRCLAPARAAASASTTYSRRSKAARPLRARLLARRPPRRLRQRPRLLHRGSRLLLPAASQASAVLESAVPREKMYFGHYEVQPMSVMRQKIAEHMVLSKRVSPHVYSVEEVDVTAHRHLRAKIERPSSSRPPERSSRSCLSSCARQWRRCARFPP